MQATGQSGTAEQHRKCAIPECPWVLHDLTYSMSGAPQPAEAQLSREGMCLPGCARPAGALTAPAACFSPAQALEALHRDVLRCFQAWLRDCGCPFRARDVHTPRRVDLGSAPAGADLALGSQAQKEAGEAQAQSMSTRGFVNPGGGGFTPDTANTAPPAGDLAGMRHALLTLPWLGHLLLFSSCFTERVL